MTRARIIFALVVVGAAYAAIAVALRRHVIASAPEPSPEQLRQYTTPGIETALSDPEKLLTFITAPQTPYKERKAATLRGAESIPPEFVPRVMTMIGELRDEFALHHWGLKLPLMNNVPRFLADPIPDTIPRDRTVLGHRWRLPDRRSDYPTTFAAECAAPWPWQVEGCLGNLLIWMTPRASTGLPVKAETPETARWMAACMMMPIGTDREAKLFVEATLGVHAKSVPVMRRWLDIALSPTKPEAAALVARETGGTCVKWDDPNALQIGEIVIEQIIERSPHAEARNQAAHSLSDLRYNGKYSPPRKEGVEPTLAIRAACRRAIQEGAAQWRGVYVFAVAACKNLDQPPIQLDYAGRLNGAPMSKDNFQQFVAWYDQHRDEIEEGAQRRRSLLRPVLEALNVGASH